MRLILLVLTLAIGVPLASAQAHDVVIFQLRNLCANPPPGYQPKRMN